MEHAGACGLEAELKAQVAEPPVTSKKPKIDDLQILIGADGRVVVADPLVAIVGQAPSKNNIRMIDLLMDVARKNIERLR